MKTNTIFLLFLPSTLAGILRGSFGDAMRASQITRRNESLNAEWAKTNRRAMVKSQVERVLRLGPRSKLPRGSSALFSSMEGLTQSDLRLDIDPLYDDFTEKLRSSFPLCADGRRSGDTDQDGSNSLAFEIWPNGQKVLKGKLNLYVLPSKNNKVNLRIDVYWNLNKDGTELSLLDSKNISGLQDSWVSLNVLPAVSSWYERPTGNYGLTLIVRDEAERKVPIEDVIVQMNCSDTTSLPFPNILRSSGMSSQYPLLESLSVELPPPSGGGGGGAPHHPLMRYPLPGSPSQSRLTKMEDVSFMEEDPLLTSRGNHPHQSSGSGGPFAFAPVAKKIIRSRSELLEALEALGGSRNPSEELLRRLPF